jgi:hypothetical protein
MTTVPQPQPQSSTEYAPVPPKRGNGWGVTALVLGVIAVVLSFIPVVNIAGIVLGALAAVFGIIGLVLKGRSKGTSIAGLILGVVAIVIASIVLAITAATVSAVDDAVKKVDEDSKAEHTIEYIVTVDQGTASVTYGATDGSSNEDIEGTWTKKQTVAGWDATSVMVTGDFETQGQKLTCEIKVDGETVTEQSGTSSVNCMADTY